MEASFGIGVPPLRLDAEPGAAGDLSRFAGVYGWPDRRVEVTATATGLIVTSEEGEDRGAAARRAHLPRRLHGPRHPDGHLRSFRRGRAAAGPLRHALGTPAARRVSEPAGRHLIRIRAVATPDLDAAARFLAGNARVLDRRRFERLFLGGDARPVRDAVAAFRNSDGGFGHALEPDGRTPASQPAAVAMALRTLDQADAWDEELVGRRLRVARGRRARRGRRVVRGADGGGVAARPWWRRTRGGRRRSSAPGRSRPHAACAPRRASVARRRHRTALAAYRRARARGPYRFRGVLAFLQYVPDRVRAEQAFERLGRLLFDRDLVALDPDAEGEVHTPLDFAPNPDSIARPLFDAGHDRSAPGSPRRESGRRAEAGRSTGPPGLRSPRASGADRSPWMRSAPSVPTGVSDQRWSVQIIQCGRSGSSGQAFVTLGTHPIRRSRGAPEARLEIDPAYLGRAASRDAGSGSDPAHLASPSRSKRFADAPEGRSEHPADRRVRHTLPGPSQSNRPASGDRDCDRGAHAPACSRARGDRRHADPRPQGRRWKSRRDE